MALDCLIPVVPADDNKNNRTVIGINLGMGYSCVGLHHGGRIEIIANDQGDRITPWVQFGDKGQQIGDAAKTAFHTSPSQTMFDTKRLIGRKFNTPEESSAMILAKMKEIAKAYLSKKVTHAVVTVPTYFSDAQHQATRDASTIAGLNILHIVNEPTAVAIAYGLDKQGSESWIIVYDLSGGTFDVSLLSIDDSVFEVLAAAGNAHLGGKDFDNSVIQHFIREYKKKTSTDVTKNQRAISKPKEVEKAKRTLLSQMSTKLEIKSFENGNDFSEMLTHAKFEELNMDLFCTTMKPVEQVLKDSSVRKEDVSYIVLISGLTCIPKFQQLIKEYFGKEPLKGIDPDEAVTYSAAIQGGILSGEEGVEDIVLIDVCPLTKGVKTTSSGFTKLIPRNTIVPTKISSTAAHNWPTVLTVSPTPFAFAVPPSSHQSIANSILPVTNLFILSCVHSFAQ